MNKDVFINFLFKGIPNEWRSSNLDVSLAYFNPLPIKYEYESGKQIAAAITTKSFHM